MASTLQSTTAKTNRVRAAFDPRKGVDGVASMFVGDREQVVDQRPVAVLEHVQRQGDTREHHGVEGEDRQLLAHVDQPTDPGAVLLATTARTTARPLAASHLDWGP